MPRTTRRITVHPYTVRELTVVRAVDITPGMRRLTLGGEQLDAFVSDSGHPQPAFRSDGFDDDVRLIFPYPGRDQPVLPLQLAGTVDWPRDPRAIFREYTVRRWHPRRRQLEIDVVRHGTGVATVWAHRVNPGDRIHVAGPATSQELPRADRLLVVGDDTALPAIGRLLEELGPGRRADVFVEIAEAAHRQDLSVPDGVAVTWLVRDGAPAGDPSRLIAAVREVSWGEESVFAWIAGESGVVQAIRRHLVEERGVPKDHVEFTGYWRRADVVTLEDDPVVPDPERNEEAFEKLHEMSELLPPLALRAAVNLGIPELLVRGTTAPAAIALATGADPVGVAKLLRYLHSLEIVRPLEGGGYELTDAGDYLTHDWIVDLFHVDGYGARREQALFGLEHAIRTGEEGYTTATGAPYASLLAEPWFEARMLDYLADWARYDAAPLAGLSVWRDVSSVAVRGDAAGVIAAALAEEHTGLSITIAALPSRILALTRQLDEWAPPGRDRISFAPHALFDAVPRVDAVLLAGELGPLPREDAVLALRRAAESVEPAGSVLVHEQILDPEQPDEHASEADMLAYALHGTGVRTDAELRSIVEEADLTVAEEIVFGWGERLYRVRRA